MNEEDVALDEDDVMAEDDAMQAENAQTGDQAAAGFTQVCMHPKEVGFFFCDC